mgnify:CR=1 FL=1
MIHWQRIWDDDENTIRDIPVKIIARILSFFYQGVVNLRHWLYTHKIFKETKLSCPVISVGNITVGGTGKTPCVIMLGHMLKKNGFQPAVISRGYGGRSTNPINVVSDGKTILLDSETSGDEPFLIARALKGVPVITGPRRIATGQVAIDKFGANVLICDDAMQHRQIFRDINLVLWDSEGLKGNHHVLPRGKLREPIAGIRRASAILMTRAGKDATLDAGIEEIIRDANIPVFKSIHHAQDLIRGDEGLSMAVSALRGRKVCAFCGIANPDSFKETIRAAGANILSFAAFRDHHQYNVKEIEDLTNGYIQHEADYLMTTEKDAARLKNHPEFLKSLLVLRVKMEIVPSAQPFENFIMEKIK